MCKLNLKTPYYQNRYIKKKRWVSGGDEDLDNLIAFCMSVVYMIHRMYYGLLFFQ